MPQHQFNDARLTQLRELLDIQYEKLYEFERAIETSDAPSQKIALRQQIKRDLTPRLRGTEQEYASLLANEISVELVPDAEAKEHVADLIEKSKRVEQYKNAGAPDEMVELLKEIKKKLEEPGKSAAAKLKVALPIVPLLANYELELDTENLILRSWRAIRSLFERLAR